MVRAIEVPHTACKDEFRRNPRSHRCWVFYFKPGRYIERVHFNPPSPLASIPRFLCRAFYADTEITFDVSDIETASLVFFCVYRHRIDYVFSSCLSVSYRSRFRYRCPIFNTNRASPSGVFVPFVSFCRTCDTSPCYAYDHSGSLAFFFESSMGDFVTVINFGHVSPRSKSRRFIFMNSLY